MPSAEEEEQGVFDEEDELDDSEGDDSEMDLDDDEDDDEGFPEAPLPPPPPSQPTLFPKEEPNSSTFPNPDPNPNSNYAAAPIPITPQNGSFTAVPISASDVYTPHSAHIVSSAEDSRRLMSAASMDESRRLFQRLWTDEDEITILQGFLEFTTQRGTTHASHQYDTGPFYEQIKKQLQLEFNKNQLIEKLRRLKKKYRNVVNRMVSGKEFSFKSAHEQATFEISRKIWSASIKRARDSEDDEFVPNPSSAVVEFDSGFSAGAISGDGIMSSERRFSRFSRSARRRIRRKTAEEEAAAAAAAAAGAAVEVPIAAPLDPPLSAPIPSIIEETVKSCLSPLFKELLQSAMSGSPGGIIPGIGGGICGGGLLGMNHLQWGVGNSQGNPQADEKWRNQQILELEVYLKRIELVRDQIKLTLEELKSSTPLAGG